MKISKTDNKKKAWEAFLARKTVLESRPFGVSIEISRNCNFRCNMCPQSWRPEYRAYHPEYNMAPELFERIAGELFSSMEFVQLQGLGETVASPHWPRILEMCRPYAGDVQFSLFTNLSRRDDAMWREMVRMGFQINFSCDGATKEVFETIRAHSHFESILRNLEVIRGARREFNAGELIFAVTLQRMNYRQIPEFVDFAKRYEADRVAFANAQQNFPRTAADVVASLSRLPSNPLPALGAFLNRRLAPKITIYDLPRSELAALKAAALQRGSETGVRVSFSDAFWETIDMEHPDEAASNSRARAAFNPAAEGAGENYDADINDSVRIAAHGRCFRPYFYLMVNYRGDVGLCNCLITDDSWEQMGSLREISFDEIWNSPRYRDMRWKLAGGEPPNKTCRWCFAHRVSW